MSEVLENIFALGEVFKNTFLSEVLGNKFALGEVFENTFHESESRIELEVCTPKKLL
jgi:hypothetical protein